MALKMAQRSQVFLVKIKPQMGLGTMTWQNHRCMGQTRNVAQIKKHFPRHSAGLYVYPCVLVCQDQGSPRMIRFRWVSGGELEIFWINFTPTLKIN